MSGGADKPAAIERLLTVAEAAQILHVSERTVMRMLKDRRLKKVKELGRSVRIHPRTLRNLQDEQ